MQGFHFQITALRHMGIGRRRRSLSRGWGAMPGGMQSGWHKSCPYTSGAWPCSRSSSRRASAAVSAALCVSPVHPPSVCCQVLCNLQEQRRTQFLRFLQVPELQQHRRVRHHRPLPGRSPRPARRGAVEYASSRASSARSNPRRTKVVSLHPLQSHPRTALARLGAGRRSPCTMPTTAPSAPSSSGARPDASAGGIAQSHRSDPQPSPVSATSASASATGKRPSPCSRLRADFFSAARGKCSGRASGTTRWALRRPSRALSRAL